MNQSPNRARCACGRGREEVRGPVVSLGGGGKGWGDPPSVSHDALRGSGYIGQARPQDVTPSFDFVLVDLCQLVKRKNVKKNVGFAEQCCECGWRREFEEESTTGEDPFGTSGHTHGRAGRGDLASLDPRARGCIF